MPSKAHNGKRDVAAPRPRSQNLLANFSLGKGVALGFSLVELLVVIAVIAIIAAIAIPSISSITRDAITSKDRRNASQLANLAAAARSAGYNGTWTTTQDAIGDLMAGITVSVGSQPVSIRISDMATNEILGASSNLVLTNGILRLTP